MANEKKLLKQYPAPSDNAEFIRMWAILLPEIASRENFKTVHLYQLEVLCGMYVEYKTLSDILAITGHTTGTGPGIYSGNAKIRPECNQLNKVRAEIANYTKMLGLILYKDKKTTSLDDEKKEWQ